MRTFTRYDLSSRTGLHGNLSKRLRTFWIIGWDRDRPGVIASEDADDTAIFNLELALHGRRGGLS